MSPRSSALLPDAAQTLLCQAAILNDESARRAWSRWRANGGALDDLDYPTQSVLPQLYQNLTKLGIDDPDIGRLKGAYRRCWFENQRIMHVVRPAISTLHEAGLQTMLCKGAALIAADGRDPGARPMGDVDVVVAPAEARRALEVLIDAGYWPAGRVEPNLALRVRRSLNLTGPGTDGDRLDLHWSILAGPDPGPGVFDRARPVSFLGIPTLAPSPTDSLLSIIDHGTSWHPAPVRWVLDACFLFSSAGPTIDWDLFTRRAQAQPLARQVAVSLAELRTDFQVNVPLPVLRELTRNRGGALDRVLWLAQNRHLPHGQRYPHLMSEWRSARARPYPGGSPGGFVSFLAARLQASRLRELPGRLIRQDQP
ncbi:MAG TPA: nucleotidyltransferase family protein [Acidimicrobiales bacterium]|nr:nucleotidyltransferase family protein [Acidimicrobiales bacterium]